MDARRFLAHVVRVYRQLMGVNLLSRPNGSQLP